jgi:hypothetical protein
MMPFQHNGRSLFLSVQLERDEDEGLIIRLDLQENGGSSEPDDVSCDTIDEVMQRYRPAQRGHFCALRLNPDRILATSRDTRPAMPVVPPEDL